MTSLTEYFTKGTQVLLTSWKARLRPKKYEGTATEICHTIVKDCWNKRYFQTSSQNFPEFWTRDFGWCAQALTKYYRKEVHQSLRYALNRFQEYKLITTTITTKGKPFNFPVMAIDSLPWLIHAIKVSNFHYLNFKPFLNSQIKLFYDQVINPHTGLVKPDISFSSMKDFAVRKSSCYDNCMVALLSKDLRTMKLNNPFEEFNYPDLLKRHFWEGNFFYDDLSKQPYVAGDANLFPFIFGLIKDKDMMEKSIQAIQENELDIPLPLKYTKDRSRIKFIWQERLAMKNYESNAVWTHMGPFYIKFVKHFDKEKYKEYKQAYREMIEGYAGYPEVLTANGKLFKTWFYYCDRTMLWAVNYLDL
jgi:hypothetical protein